MDESQDYVTLPNYYLDMEELKTEVLAEVRNEILHYGVNVARLVDASTMLCYVLAASAIVAAVAHLIGTLRGGRRRSR